MALIIDGKKLGEQLARKLKTKIRPGANKPKLVIFQIGDMKESSLYVQKKIGFGRKLGAIVIHKQYPEAATEKEIVADIATLNMDRTVHGIMVQLPIPKHLNTSNILNTIDPKKDVDGLGAENTKRVLDKNEYLLPATTQGILTILKHCRINPAGKKIVVVSDSRLVGRPTTLALLNRKATVTVCNFQTKNLAEETRNAEVLITATGHPHLITTDHVSPNQVVIDIGTRIINKKVVGDVDFAAVKKIVRAITPVPGGVGPMTVYSLFENLIRAYKEQTKKRS